MLDLLSDIFNVPDLLSRGVDVTVYLGLGVIGLVLLVLRLAFAMVFGDLDTDFDAGGADVSHGGDFGLFSTLSVLAFLTAMGWTGVLCRVDLELGHLPSALIAAVVGFVFMLVAAGLLFHVRKLNHTVTYQPGTAVGKTATVYLSIPKRGEGSGQVTVTVSGRRMTMNAISSGDAIAAFTEVVVKEARDDETLVVEPKYPAAGEDAGAPR